MTNQPGKPKTGREDWYRNTEWNPEIREAFFTRLKRSRSQKDQHLKIQASYLVPVAPAVALELIERYFEVRDGTQFDAGAHLTRAEAHRQLGDHASAVAALKAALKSEREHRSIKTEAPFELAMLVAMGKLRDEYEAALTALDHRDEGLVLPVHAFKWNAACAVILDDLGRLQDAARCADVALEAAERTESPFQYHRAAGLVDEEHAPTVRALEDIRKRAQADR